MKTFIKLTIIAFVLSFFTPFYAEVTREGNNFTQVTKQKTTGQETLTEYTYTDSKGNKYPVYLSSTGKAYIKKVSKKTGKEYKQYVPEIGKQINPEAYKEKERK